jgi:hypothetical protein
MDRRRLLAHTPASMVMRLGGSASRPLAALRTGVHSPRCGQAHNGGSRASTLSGHESVGRRASPGALARNETVTVQRRG